METASVSMDGRDRLVNFYAHSVNLDVTAPNAATVKTEQVVTVKQDGVNVYPDGVVNIVRNHVPVDITDQSVKRHVNVKMEQFVMR